MRLQCPYCTVKISKIAHTNSTKRFLIGAFLSLFLPVKYVSLAMFLIISSSATSILLTEGKLYSELEHLLKIDRKWCKSFIKRIIFIIMIKQIGCKVRSILYVLYQVNVD